MNDSPSFEEMAPQNGSNSGSGSNESPYKSLSWRLGHFDHSLEAMQELRSQFFRNEHVLPDDEFRILASTVS